MTETYTGRCQCGAVRYEINKKPQTVHACHCTECQKRSGSAFGLTMIVERDSFAVQGELASYIRTSDNDTKVTSYFCPNCGNPIYGELERSPDILALRPGTLDDTKWFKLDRMIWADSAQSWVEFSDKIETLPKGRW